MPDQKGELLAGGNGEIFYHVFEGCFPSMVIHWIVIEFHDLLATSSLQAIKSTYDLMLSVSVDGGSFRLVMLNSGIAGFIVEEGVICCGFIWWWGFDVVFAVFFTNIRFSEAFLYPS